MRKRVWSPVSPGVVATLEVSQQPLRHRDGLGLVGDDDVDHAVGRLHRDRSDVVGLDLAEPAAGDHRGPAHADRRVLGGDDQIGAPGDDRVAGKAAALDDRDPWHHPRQCRPQLERARVERRDDGVVRVAGTSAAALGEEHGGQPHPLDEFEEPVLLSMAERALCTGKHGVVVGQHRARAALVAE